MKKAPRVLSLIRLTAICAALVASASCHTDRPLARRESGDAQLLARGIASALSDEGVRTSVRQAMRASLLVNHKLELQEYLSGSEGHRLLDVAASRLGTTVRDLSATASALPPMEFLVARRNDRLEWRGGDVVVVGVTLDNDVAPDLVYTSGGGAEKYAKDLAATLFIIQPLEGRSLRIRPQAAIPGEVIQESTDGEGGGSYMLWDAHGRLVYAVELAELYAARDRRGGSGPDSVSFSYGSGDSTYVDYFTTNASDGVPEDMEIEFRATFYNHANQLVASGTLRTEGVLPETEYFWHELMIHARADNNSAAKVRVNIVETDAFFDDNMGTRDFTWGDNGQTRTIEGSGDVSNLKLGWTAIPAFQLVVSGPTLVYPGATCTYTVTYSGGTPPYHSEQWYVDGTSFGGGSTLVLLMDYVPDVNHRAFDTNGVFKSHGLLIEYSDSAPSDPRCTIP